MLIGTRYYKLNLVCEGIEVAETILFDDGQGRTYEYSIPQAVVRNVRQAERWMQLYPLRQRPFLVRLAMELRFRWRRLCPPKPGVAVA